MIRYKAGYKYQLVEDAYFKTDIHPDTLIENEFISLDVDGNLTVKEYYAWDGPSGPTLDTKTFMRGSLAHDALYQMIREDLLKVHDARELADKELRKICLRDGMWKVRAWWVYRGVRIGAEEASIHGREVKEAP